MSPEEKEDAKFLLKQAAITIPGALLIAVLAWFLCWGRYWWPELTWLP